MLQLLIRRTLLAVLLIPALNMLGYMYALNAQPLHFGFSGNLVEVEPHHDGLWYSYRQYIAAAKLGDWQTKGIDWSGSLINSGQLLGVTVVVVVFLGLLLAFLSINPRTRRVRSSAITLYTVGATIPGFFLATIAMLLLIIGKRQGWYEARGHLIPIQGSGWDAHLILPVCTLALRPVLYTASITASLLEQEFQQDYVQVARSRGLGWVRIILSHTFPNVQAAALIALGQSLQFVIGSMLLVEYLFDWRGVGWLFVRIFIEPDRGNTSGFLMNAPVLAVLLPLIGFLMLVVDTIPRLIAYKRDPRLNHA